MFLREKEKSQPKKAKKKKNKKKKKQKHGISLPCSVCILSHNTIHYIASCKKNNNRNRN